MGKPLGTIKKTTWEMFEDRTCSDAAAQQHVLCIGLTLAEFVT